MNRAIDYLNQPLLERSHNHHIEMVRQHFPHLKFRHSTDAVVLKDFVEGIPQKYFTQECYWQAIKFAQEFDVKAYSSYLPELDRAIVALKSINCRKWHETEIPTGINVADMIGFIEDDFFQAYLQLAESVWYILLKPFGEASRRKRGVKEDGMSLHMLKDELTKMVSQEYQVLHENYLPVVRNAIGHNSILYDDYNITFIDRKTKESMPYEDFIQLVDGFLDNCNALYLFYLSVFLTEDVGELPEAILYEKTSVLNNSPWFHVNRVVPSFVNNQLVASVTLKTRHEFLAQHSIIKLLFDMWYNAPKYNRYFLFITSPYCLASTAYFSAESLNIGKSDNLSIEEFVSRTKVLLMWKKRIWRIRESGKLSHMNNLYNSFKASWSIEIGNIISDLKNQLGIPHFTVKHSAIHNNKVRTVVRSAIFLHETHQDKNEVISTICKHTYRFLRAAVKHAKQGKPILSHLRYRMVGYIEVCVYAHDYRSRTMRRLCLHKDLICRVIYHGIKRIRTVHLHESEVVRKGKIRYEWNRAWLDS